MSGSKFGNTTKPPPSPSQPEERQRLTSIVRCARLWERRSEHLTSAGRSAQSPSKGGGGRKLSTSVSIKKVTEGNTISSESGFAGFHQPFTHGNLKKSDRREHDLVRVRVYGSLLVFQVCTFIFLNLVFFQDEIAVLISSSAGGNLYLLLDLVRLANYLDTALDYL